MVAVTNSFLCWIYRRPVLISTDPMPLNFRLAEGRFLLLQFQVRLLEGILCSVVSVITRGISRLLDGNTRLLIMMCLLRVAYQLLPRLNSLLLLQLISLQWRSPKLVRH